MDYMESLASLSLGSRLKRLSEQLFAEVAVIYESVGLKLNPNYFLLINLINQKGPMGIIQIAESLSISHPAVSKLASKMVAEGYLIKQAHPSDKRASNLSLTLQSLQIIEQATPIWKILKKHLDLIESEQNMPLLSSLNQFEKSLTSYKLNEKVLKEALQEIHEIKIVNWNNEYKNDFKALNMVWLNSEFNGELTKADQQALNQPESYYLAQGGYLFFAKQGNEIIGCIAIKPANLNSFEISKMAVASGYQGQGIGRKLLLKSLNKARDLQVKTVFLETNSNLTRAISLYQHVGFMTKKHPNGKSDYHRADIYMELQLHA
ncbi:MarR family transcriptional regulator [Psychromonas marina]|uniref:MarR family transcriptional regulator n=1 Tax=Psychromonas marina TaxID=88364 RepID=A0ABQ6DX65_9GAMM|nr:bifunctional helix-turn-helix transcriptional regulator/GNAT family N-acetyltransferase [Psychromonas marina]GLS89722.1 MarR family transcriptional regulator [Psychromonas marina]